MADRQHEQAHFEPFGEGASSRFVEPRSGQSGEYTSPYSSPPAGLVGQEGECLV